jgi:hypothetical protein
MLYPCRVVWVGITRVGILLGLIGSRLLCGLVWVDHHGYHISVFKASSLQLLIPVSQGRAIEEELLFLGRKPGLGLDEALQLAHSQVESQVQGQELLVVWLSWSIYGDGDSRPVVNPVIVSRMASSLKGQK